MVAFIETCLNIVEEGVVVGSTLVAFITYQYKKIK
jgi:hypothetical protein